MDGEIDRMISKNEVMTVEAVAESVGVQVDVVVDWIKRGNIKRYNTPRNSGLVMFSDIADYMRKHGIKPRSGTGSRLPEGGDSELRSVLVVDDDAMVRGMMTQVLCPLYSLYQAANGFDALKIVKRHRDIRLVLLDIRMPGQSGVEAYEEIKKVRSEIRIVIVSGYIEDVPDSMMADSNVLGVIEKPISEEMLVDTVARALDSELST